MAYLGVAVAVSVISGVACAAPVLDGGEGPVPSTLETVWREVQIVVLEGDWVDNLTVSWLFHGWPRVFY